MKIVIIRHFSSPSTGRAATFFFLIEEGCLINCVVGISKEDMSTEKRPTTLALFTSRGGKVTERFEGGEYSVLDVFFWPYPATKAHC